VGGCACVWHRWTPSHKAGDERSAVNLIEAMAASPTVLSSLQQLIIFKASDFAIPVRHKYGSHSALSSHPLGVYSSHGRSLHC
jgi:hypothetical protein